MTTQAPTENHPVRSRVSVAQQMIYIGMDPSVLRDEDRLIIEQVAKKSGYRVVVSNDDARFEEVLHDVVIATGLVPVELLAQARSLKWFQQFGSGGDWITSQKGIRDSALTITGISDNHYRSLAEHVFAFILAIVRQLHLSVRAQTEHRWHKPEKESLVDLSEMNLLLLGVGSIGKRVAHLANAFGMRITGLRRERKQAEAPLEQCVSGEELFDVLPNADIVVDCLPLTQETRHMIDGAAFRAMKNTAIFVNIGRGGTVDQDALIEALQKGEIAAAGLDVFETEPLPQDSPLWDMENVLITGHYAGLSHSLFQRCIDVFIDNLRRYLSGERLRNALDKRRCY